MLVNLVLAVDCLFPYVCMSTPTVLCQCVSTCTCMSLSVLVFILVYIFSAYSPDYGFYTIGQSVTVFPITRSSAWYNLVYIMAVLLSIFVYAYCTKLNSLIAV